MRSPSVVSVARRKDAAFVSSLVSDRARYITGAVLDVNSGILTR
jgi:hypothetical protein